ncbi:hypothetical protein ACD591_16165 [Rufibacter glacialis]|uniref:Uncharacterized protein n=1 Tax=Rufibacter glacialis TaxID=1259555 RepID=A0A5M8QQK8_9BACT|nr:hypothetical protein [Rufibacter glacialis]KAA6437521.1 hypothetical protein FOE74_03180 [Rufibacter glacialis]GGK58638.1 hypothetical protein GCM10011405_03400 [Rufibacter glacialis]
MEKSHKGVKATFEGLKGAGGRRRDLLPWWMKAFIWFFLLAGGILPIGLVMGLLGYSFSLSLYGFETNNPFSPTGIFLMVLFLLKAITAFGLWTEKNWAIKVGILDAVIGLLACGAAMLVLPLIDTSEGFVFNFRLEPFLLVLYLLRLHKIKNSWQGA